MQTANENCVVWHVCSPTVVLDILVVVVWPHGAGGKVNPGMRRHDDVETANDRRGNSTVTTATGGGVPRQLRAAVPRGSRACSRESSTYVG